MPKSIKVSTNFTAGEISPRLLGRTDLKKYSNGVRTLENFIPQVHGGVERRPGTIFVQEINTQGDPTYPPKLIEFQYNQEQSYVLELGVNTSGVSYIRFFRISTITGLPIILTTISGAATTITGNWTGTELADLQFAQSADVLYVFCGTKPIHKLSRVATDDSFPLSWTYEECDFKDGPYLPINSSETNWLKHNSDGTGAVGENVTIYMSEATFDITSPSKDIGRHVRIEDDSVEYSIVDFSAGIWADTGGDGVFEWETPARITVAQNTTSGAHTSIHATVGTGHMSGVRVEFLKVTLGLPELNDTVYAARNFTYNSTTERTTFDLYHPDTGEAVGFSYFNGSEADASGCDGVVRIERASHVGWGKITSVTNSRTAIISVEKELPTGKGSSESGSMTLNWSLGAWCELQGYPRTGRFYQNRLWVASTTLEPQTIWASETGAFNCYAPTMPSSGQVTAESAITVTLADAKVNRINHLEGDTSGLIILTSGGEWIGRASNPQSPLTPLDMGFQKNSHYGTTASAYPIRSGTSIMFVQRDARSVRELAYEFGEDRFNAPNITLLSEHITGAGLIDSAYQSGKSNRLWYVRSDGVVLSMTHEKSEEVLGWARHNLAPSKAGVAAEAISIAATLDDTVDNIWMIVKRDVDGTDKYYVEMLDAGLQSYEAHEHAFYVDSGVKQYNASGATTWSGLDHLAGEDVYVLGDGEQQGPLTVSAGGEITTTSIVRAQIGLKYTSTMETLPLVIEDSRNESRGKLKRVYKVMANLYRSLGGKLGTPEQMYAISYPTATSTVLNTKMFEVSMPDNAQRETIVKFEQDTVQPANLLSIVSEFQIGQF